MKRSEVNAIMAAADEFINSFGFRLPPFAYWSPEQMAARRSEIDGIIDAKLGWDITDYARGRFDELGLVLFTLRNGNPADLERGRGMVYAEKIMISRENQISPMHTHARKTEDIINRGGATLAIELFGSDADGRFDKNAGGQVRCDGVEHEFAPGEILKLAPGESVTLSPGRWHKFWGKGGDVLIGEVSTVNDDVTDNIFREPIGRFAEIEEDVPPTHLLVADYDRWF